MIPTTYEELLELYEQQGKSRLSLLSMIEGLRSLCLSQESENRKLYNENVELSNSLEQVKSRLQSYEV